MSKPLILVSNDDGITSKGIRVLIEAMCQIGEVIVVAPDSPQSGMGHAITIGNVIKDRTLDLVVSGVNHGSNLAISVLYSGTMSAAIEGAIEGFPSIGYSLADFSLKADFSHAIDQIIHIAKEVLEKGMAKNVALNVNIPPKQNEKIKGIKVCRQAKAHWQEEFDQRKDPYGRPYFWLAGNFVNNDKGEDTDVWAVDHNYVSVVPCQYDMTAYHSIAQINDDWDI